MKMNLTELDALISEVIVGANGEDKQLWAFRQAFEDALALPADGFVTVSYTHLTLPTKRIV